MSVPSNLCLKCFKPTNGQSVCPNCGWSFVQNKEPYIKNGTLLQGRYTVGVLLSTNGEGATYSGWDNTMNSPVSIREFFPDNLCVRSSIDDSVRVISGFEEPFDEYMHDFLKLYRMLAKLRDIPALVPVYDIFEANNTAYSITELIGGSEFSEVMEHHKPLTFKQTRSLFMPVINAVAALHAAGVCHYSINPSNLLADTDGHLRLINFSIAAVNCAGTYLKPQIFEGYSAIEQYKAGSDLGTYTDVYSLTATIYFAMTGSVVEPVLRRLNNEVFAVPPSLCEQLTPNATSALVKALKVHPELRTHSVDRFKQEFTASSAVSGVVKEYEQEQAAVSNAVAANDISPQQYENDYPENIEQPDKSKDKQMIGMIIISSVLALLLIISIIVIFAMWNSNRKDDETAPSEIVSVSSQEPSSEIVSIPEASQIVGGYAIPAGLIGSDFETVSQSKQWDYMNIQIGNYAFSDTYEEGTIIAADPDVETIIQEGQTVNVTVSLGPEMRTLPSVIGKKAYKAAADLSQRGFNVRISETSDTQKEAGTVVAVSLNEGNRYKYGTWVTLTVSTYVPPANSTPAESSDEPVSDEPPAEGDNGTSESTL